MCQIRWYVEGGLSLNIIGTVMNKKKKDDFAIFAISGFSVDSNIHGRSWESAKQKWLCEVEVFIMLVNCIVLLYLGYPYL